MCGWLFSQAQRVLQQNIVVDLLFHFISFHILSKIQIEIEKEEN